MKKYIFPLLFVAVVALALLIYGDSSTGNLAQVLTSTVPRRSSVAWVFSGPFKITSPSNIKILVGIETVKGGGAPHRFNLEQGWQITYNPTSNRVAVFDSLSNQELASFVPPGSQITNKVSVELNEQKPSGERSAIIKLIEVITPPRDQRLNY